MFNSIFDSSLNSLSFVTILLCFLTSIILGLVVAFTHMKTSRYTKNFIITLVILPTLVEVVMIMVNGNLGTSVAILGAFSLVRFRSIPGNSKEITIIFLAMAIGLSVGMGHLLFAILLTVIVCLLIFILSYSKFGENEIKNLKITIPEDLDYTGVFKDIFDKYMKEVDLQKVKTTNMGSTYDLTYKIKLKKDVNEKELIDEIRVRNGNLTILLTDPIIEQEL